MSVASVAAMGSTKQVLREAAEALRRARVETPQLDAEWLLAAAWNADRAALRTGAETPVPPAVVQRFRTMVQRRLAREPLQYIVGTWGFWDLDLLVTPAVLIPRPETETLVERALAIAADRRCLPSGGGAGPCVADVGTGSGCIAIALARGLGDAEVWATDCAPEALEVAARNAQRMGVAGRIRFAEADLTAGLPRCAFDVVVSNPPYVASADLTTLEPELGWEPRGALDGGRDGLDVLRRLIPATAEVLRPGGSMLLEIGSDQVRSVREILLAGPWADIAVHLDLGRRPRVVEARRRGDA